jgi:hypothetical protein
MGENLVFGLALDHLPELASAYFDCAFRRVVATVRDPLLHGAHDIGLLLGLQVAEKYRTCRSIALPTNRPLDGHRRQVRLKAAL